MQANFTAFNETATEVRTMEHKGLTLVWSEPDKRFMLPQPDGAPSKVLFDTDTQTFIQITITDPSFVYRDRTATSPDGTVIQERILIGKDKSGNTVEIPDADFQKVMLRAQILDFQKKAVEMASGWLPVFYLGVLACMIAFFWQLAGAAGLLAESFATGSMAATNEVGYYLAWGAGILVAGLILYHVVPRLFRRAETDDVPTYSVPGDRPAAGTNTTNINIIQGAANTGTSAQDYINGRRL